MAEVQLCNKSSLFTADEYCYCYRKIHIKDFTSGMTCNFSAVPINIEIEPTATFLMVEMLQTSKYYDGFNNSPHRGDHPLYYSV